MTQTHARAFLSTPANETRSGIHWRDDHSTKGIPVNTRAPRDGWVRRCPRLDELDGSPQQ